MEFKDLEDFFQQTLTRDQLDKLFLYMAMTNTGPEKFVSYAIALLIKSLAEVAYGRVIVAVDEKGGKYKPLEMDIFDKMRNKINS
jgi:hypothetical protein